MGTSNAPEPIVIWQGDVISGKLISCPDVRTVAEPEDPACRSPPSSVIISPCPFIRLSRIINPMRLRLTALNTSDGDSRYGQQLPEFGYIHSDSALNSRRRCWPYCSRRGGRHGSMRSVGSLNRVRRECGKPRLFFGGGAG